MVKERRDGTPQLNLRVPLEHHERVHKVVALLQSTEAFAARLDELMATASEPPKESFLSEVVDRIERLEAALAVQVELNARRTASDASNAVKLPSSLSDLTVWRNFQLTRFHIL